MKIAIVSAEALPFSKTGGLGDVVGALFKELLKAGIDVKLFLPYYRITKNNLLDNTENTGIVYGVTIGKEKKFGAVRSLRATIDSEGELTFKPDKAGNIYFVEHNDFFDRDQLYGTSYGEYLDNAERFIFFSRAILEMCRILDLKFEIIHCHDWHTALIPLYLKTLYKECMCFERTSTILTIHNLGYQGVFPREKLELTGFGWEMFHIDCLEFYGMINFLKAGIFNADVITTVSPTYAKEILTPEYGFGLDGVLKKRQDKLIGILNGIDYNIWDPERDVNIVKNYGMGNFNDKIQNKEELLKITKLKCPIDSPLIAFIGRMVTQKGVDLLAEAVPKLIERGINFIFEGTGEHYYESKIKELENSFPKNIYAFIGFDEVLAHKIYAGADAIIIPSRYEPCGLSQLIAMRYGTIPLCRKTGGLADTVEDGITGFLFSEYKVDELISMVNRFMEVYQREEQFKAMILNAMSKDFSWEKACLRYMELYRSIR
ncbi:glycogen synthase GlgA [Thermodesulfovibrio sp.]|uniref:glycogen synthase GlgA n=1 Tax=Thermodesulfovibrio TaxID=28261 RepID=UPI0026214019|nr:glycogen synthase GlgA [Thermodesulfovibrio sp.]